MEFQLDRADIIIAALSVLVTYLVLTWLEKLPPVSSVQALVAQANSRGGNIIVLGTLSMVFFHSSMKLFYNLMDRLQDGKITPDNAVALTAISFVSGTAFGGAFGALLKTMTGENSSSRAEDRKPEPKKQTSDEIPETPIPPDRAVVTNTLNVSGARGWP